MNLAAGTVIPILRIFDETKAREFYEDYLGFEVDWEHRFEDGLPLYMSVSRGKTIIHLSEHHGDASPGAAVRIVSDDLDGYLAELEAKDYTHCRPIIEKMPWKTRDMTVTDPFGNRLIFTTDVEN